MGVSLSWIAVEALPDEQVLDRLAMTRTTKRSAYPFKSVACSNLPSGWFLVAAWRCDHRIVTRASMSALSRGCQAISCSIEEHVNFARTEYWRDGLRVWQVQHEGDEDSENMTSEGRLPERFHELLATAEPQDSENLDGHFHMDIPLVLAKELCGFRHDGSAADLGATVFVELSEKSAKRSWWRW